ncbi:unnamed protein product [Musa acuminata var. zebrina]
MVLVLLLDLMHTGNSSLSAEGLKMSIIQDDEFAIKLGVTGRVSHRSSKWDEVCYGKIKQILITHGDAINSIQVAYDFKGTPILAHRHGGDGDRFDCINLLSWETLTVVKGYYGPLGNDGIDVVLSLTFVTNGGNTYGPFGRESGTPFCFNIRNGVHFWGFHGYSNSRYLCNIGIYVKPTAEYKYHFLPKPEKFVAARSVCNVSS